MWEYDSIEQFLEYHPKPWQPADGETYLEDAKGQVITDGDLLEYIKFLEEKAWQYDQLCK